MFAKILIANRGEIAVRIIRACKEMGITSIAVYSDLDRDALHVRLADEAYALGGQTAAESYLNTEAILEIIERSGAEAVHPGYGFFSENADFASEITKRGVAFIGPSPEAIEIMGNKISAREAAEKVGVDGVPGSNDIISEAGEVVAFGDKFGWPVAIKAAYGGGGRGMKVVQEAAEAEAALESAQRESLSYFGRQECYMERYLVAPRHVEMQIMADSHGNVVWLGERDCSAQRRHQKLIEESPAPDLSDEVRTAMGEASVKVAKGCDYVNAGTVEFLYEDGEFYYLEMNTRLQVEHPVTELVTGIDLVAEQIRVAAGEMLSFTQADISSRGHAIEARINAEDPSQGRFLPSPGTISKMALPQGAGVRWDGGYEQGDEVSQFYDNLVGKLIVWAPTRAAAISRLLRALDELTIEGIATTSPAHVAILSHEDFRSGKHSTKWVEDTLDLTDVSSTVTPAQGDDGEPTVRKDVDVEVNGRKFSVSVWVPDAEAPKKRRTRSSSAATASSNGSITAPMQGNIIKVLVEVGDQVEAGQAVAVLEAMKMENNIAAETAGEVTAVKVSVGDSVGAGDVMVTIEPKTE